MLRGFPIPLGIESERFRPERISAAKGDRFARVIKEMVAKIRELGSSPLRVG